MSYSHTSTVPIEMLPGIGRRTAKVLRSMQVRTVGQFKALPERMLVELFGPSIKSVYQIVHPSQPAQKPMVRFQVKPKLVAQKQLSLGQKFRLATQMLMM